MANSEKLAEIKAYNRSVNHANSAYAVDLMNLSDDAKAKFMEIRANYPKELTPESKEKLVKESKEFLSQYCESQTRLKEVLRA